MKSRIGRRTRRWVLCAAGGLAVAGPSFLTASDPTPRQVGDTSAGVVRIRSAQPSTQFRAVQPRLEEPRPLIPPPNSLPIGAVTELPAPVRQIAGEKSEAAQYFEALYAPNDLSGQSAPAFVPPAPAAPDTFSPPLHHSHKPNIFARLLSVFRRRPRPQQEFTPPEPAPPAIVQGSYFPPPLPPAADPNIAQTVAPVPPAPAAAVAPPPAPPALNPFDDLPQQADRGTAGSPDASVAKSGDEIEPSTVANAAAPVIDDFADPFIELSEEEADRNLSPYTGLKLTEPSLEVPSKDAAAVTASTDEFESPVENDPAVTPRKQTDAPAAAETRVASTPETSDDKDPKLRKIKEREELQGLKGFCPVVLRDERDLRDTRPEFTAAYMGVTYQFSSAEAKEKFEADPEKYAPIQQGTDVVLLVGESRYSRGSIERAVWFRDRLYLFSSDESLSTFKREPARFAQER